LTGIVLLPDLTTFLPFELSVTAIGIDCTAEDLTTFLPCDVNFIVTDVEIGGDKTILSFNPLT
jgi:hypothetical protein